MTQVPWLLLIPRLPAIFGTETFAIVMSSTAMKFAAASTMAAIHSMPPCKGEFRCAGFSWLDMTVPSARVLACIDRGGHRQPDLQGMRDKLVGIELNSHGHPLHHFDPIACGVLRRDGRESRASAARESRHYSVIDRGAAVKIGLELHGLPDPH